MEEVWKDIKDYEGLYQVSNLGNVRSLGRYVPTKGGSKRYVEGKTIAPIIAENGYKRICLSKNGKGKMHFVARLVASEFPEICGEWFEGAEVDHINTVRIDNRPENLRWVDRKTNQNNPLTLKHKSDCRLGKQMSESAKSKMIASLRNNSSVSKWVIKLSLDNEILHFYPSVKQAERETGIQDSNISACCRGEYKQAGNYIWKYAD